MPYPQYDRASNHLPLDDQELQDFDDLLAALPVDGAMNVEGVDGFLTAMLLAPPAWLDTWPTADWLPQVWGGDGPDGQPFASGRQRKRAVLLSLRHLRAIDWALQEHARRGDAAQGAWEPLFSVVELEGQRGHEWIDAADWCAGFLQAVDLEPAAWEAWRNDAELAPVLRTIALLGGDEEPAVDSEEARRLADPEGRDGLAREVADGVLEMFARRQAG
ncbi:UPF0149 family protein [Ideonella sp.]|uniref:UPF0149 family protein n=1 Tax=Ideonella sp. TaxID=1929293 RepID=UPI0035B040AD